MAKGYEIREYAKKHGVSDAEALKALSHDKHGELVKRLYGLARGPDVLAIRGMQGALLDAAEALSAPSAIDSIPEGCTPTDARVLRDGNFKLAEENHELRRALRFYANGEHYHGLLHWEGPSGDDNWLCPPGEDELMPEHRAEFIANMDEATVEDGSIAAAALSGKWLVVESPEDEPKVVEGEPEWHIEQSARTETDTTAVLATQDGLTPLGQRIAALEAYEIILNQIAEVVGIETPYGALPDAVKDLAQRAEADADQAKAPEFVPVDFRDWLVSLPPEDTKAIFARVWDLYDGPHGE